VHPDEHVLLSRDFAVDQGDVFVFVDIVLVPDDPELAVVGRQPGLGDPMHQALGAEPVLHQVATVTKVRPNLSAMALSSGCRAIVPSAFRISQMTPAGWSPASRARSTLASVWPTRCRTPPGRARRGKT
jgi:hypothetical protein